MTDSIQDIIDESKWTKEGYMTDAEIKGRIKEYMYVHRLHMSIDPIGTAYNPDIHIEEQFREWLETKRMTISQFESFSRMTIEDLLHYSALERMAKMLTLKEEFDTLSNTPEISLEGKKQHLMDIKQRYLQLFDCPSVSRHERYM